MTERGGQMHFGLRCVLGAVVLLAACAPAEEWAGTIEDRDGVVYVDNPAEGLWSARQPPPLAFELEQEFGAELEPPEAIIGQVRSYAVDAAGNVYVLDRQPLRLLSFAPDGGVRWTAGREGEGPGELNNPRGIAVAGSSLYLVNRGGTAVDEWDSDGNFRAARSLVGLEIGLVSPAGFLPPDKLVVSRVMMGATGVTVSAVELAEPPALAARFEHNALPERPLPEHFGMEVDVAVRGDRIVLGSTGRYEFRVYDGAGNLERVVRRDVDYLVGAGISTTESGSMIAGYGGLDAPVRLQSGHWIARVVWPTNVDDPDGATAMMMSDDFRPVFNTSYDLFDPEGRFLYSLVFEDTSEGEIGSRLQLGGDGALYAQLSDPFPQVRRYRVAIGE